MRLRATVRVTIPSAQAQTDDGDSFWRAFANHVSPPGAEPPPDFHRFVQEQEDGIRQLLPLYLETHLRRYAYDAAIIISSITYGTLNISLDVISKLFDESGLSADDILSLLSTYTPQSIINIYTGLRRGDARVHAEATGHLIDDKPEVVAGDVSPSRIDRIWTIANTSLVIPSLVLLVAAYVIFQTAANERDRITSAILQERAELATQMQKLIDHADSQQKGFEDNLNAEMGHFRDLYQLEIQVMKTRLDQIKSQNKQ